MSTVSFKRACRHGRTSLLTRKSDRQLDVTTCDVQKAIIGRQTPTARLWQFMSLWTANSPLPPARNILLLTLILDDTDAQHDTLIWNIYYHMRLDRASDDLLQAQAKKLIALSTTIESWQQSKYGTQLKICDTATLADARTMWSLYSSSRNDTGKTTIQKRLQAAVDIAKKTKDERQGLVITGIRSASPAHIHAFVDVDSLHQHFWKEGTTDVAHKVVNKAELPNPMFLTVDDTSTLHYGTDPLLGFHLAPAYMPLEPQSPLHVSKETNKYTQLQRVVDTARLEFKQWVASFRKHAGTITVRFFVGDAIAFAHTLHHSRATGSPIAGFYRENYQLQPLELLDGDYGATGSAPVVFDIVDTSNVCDHVGPLNLLTAVSPLLRNKLAATLYTEVIPNLKAKNRKEIVDIMLCGDTPTISTLLALFPVEYWTNAACVSYGDESLFEALKSPASNDTTVQQMYLRVAWKRPPCLAPSSDSETSELRLGPIQFAEHELAKVLYEIYVRMFEDENWSKKFADISLRPVSAGNQQPQYHRAGFAAFLRLVKNRVACNWNKSMATFHDLVAERSGAPMNAHYFQELCAYLHLLDVWTVGIYKQPKFSVDLSSGPVSHQLRTWSNVPPVICITLKVPRKHLAAFTGADRRSYGTPTVHCKVRSTGGNWENLFSACHFSFGAISTTGVRGSDDFGVRVAEDKAGWDGNSALVVTFYTPTWGILRDYSSTTVSFGLHTTPLVLVRFMKHYGMTLTVFETAIDNTEHVYITKYAPHLQGSPTVTGFTPDQVMVQSDANEVVKQSLTAGVSSKTGRILTMTGRFEFESEDFQALLRGGARISVANPSPCQVSVTLGEGKPLDLFFPVPVLATSQKTRIARKSLYIEVIAEVATVSSSAEFPTSFVQSLYLTGAKKVPLAWSMSHLNLQKQPAFNLSQVSKIDWLNTHFSLQMSNRERTLRDDPMLPRSPGERVRFEFKEGLFSLLVQFAGLQGPRFSHFGISNPSNGGVHILVFPQKLRLDLATRTVVLDCAVLPLHRNIMPQLAKFIHGLTKGAKLVQILADDDELRMWKQVLPAWVERCRGTMWRHGEDCEYRATGRIPLTDEHDDKQFLCSCGQGVFPGDFEVAGVPEWVTIAKQYATRAAISPLFWAPFADEVYVAPMPTAPGVSETGGCLICGRRKKPDGGFLMRCGGCHQAEYCSAQCQRKDWTMHKRICSGRRA